MSFVNTIVNANNVEYLKTIDAEAFDATITSPPYDDLRTYKGYSFDFENLASELYRVTKTGGVVVWVVGDGTDKNGSETGTSFRQALHFKDIGFNIHDTMIYQKTNFSNPAKNKYHQIFEYMFVLSKGKPKTFNPIKDRKNIYAGHTTYGKNTVTQTDGSKKVRASKVYSEYGQRFNIWTYKTTGQTGESKKYNHPAMFPEQMVTDHILSWTNPGDIVLDPFVGSGTTCVSAKNNGRLYLGIDISPEYCKIAEDRIGESNAKE